MNAIIDKQARRSAIHKLRVNVKSLAAEGRFIRYEIRRADAAAISSLQSHRATRVKPEARYAGLALAYLRGVPYRAVESRVREGHEVIPAVLQAKLRKFIYAVNYLDDVAAWLSVPA